MIIESADIWAIFERRWQNTLVFRSECRLYIPLTKTTKNVWEPFPYSKFTLLHGIIEALSTIHQSDTRQQTSSDVKLIIGGLLTSLCSNSYGVVGRSVFKGVKFVIATCWQPDGQLDSAVDSWGWALCWITSEWSWPQIFSSWPYHVQWHDKVAFDVRKRPELRQACSVNETKQYNGSEMCVTKK